MNPDIAALIAVVQQMDGAARQSAGLHTIALQAVVANTTATVSALAGVTTAIQSLPGGGGNPPPPPPPPNPNAPKPKSKGFFRGFAGRLKTGAAVLGKLGGGGAGLASAAGGGLGTAASKVAGPIGVAAAVGEAFVKAGEAVRNFAYEQEQVARRLAQISPSQAANLAQLDVNRTFRDLDTGEATAGSGKQMTESLDHFEKTVQPIETALIDLKNTVGSGLLDVLSAILSPLKALAERFAGKSKEEDAPEMFGEFLHRIAEEQRIRGELAQARIDAVRRAEERRRKGG